MTDRDAVLALNQAFYRAFTERNFAAMDALWAASLPVSCVHPGWGVLIGREAVMNSWEDVLGAPTGPVIEPRNERVMLYGDSALVLCEEVLGGAVLSASNLFMREDGAWRLVHHQAGPIADPRAILGLPADDELPPRLH